MTEIPHRRIADPKTHYGSGKAQTRLFTTQRLTAAFNLGFLLFIVWFVVRLAGAERTEMVGVLRNPLAAIAMALLVINVPIHMRIGMGEIIEDYVHEDSRHRLAMRANDLFAGLVAAIGLLCVIKILFWG